VVAEALEGRRAHLRSLPAGAALVGRGVRSDLRPPVLTGGPFELGRALEPGPADVVHAPAEYGPVGLGTPGDAHAAAMILTGDVAIVTRGEDPAVGGGGGRRRRRESRGQQYENGACHGSILRGRVVTAGARPQPIRPKRFLRQPPETGSLRRSVGDARIMENREATQIRAPSQRGVRAARQPASGCCEPIRLSPPRNKLGASYNCSCDE